MCLISSELFRMVARAATRIEMPLTKTGGQGEWTETEHWDIPD